MPFTTEAQVAWPVAMGWSWPLSRMATSMGTVSRAFSEIEPNSKSSTLSLNSTTPVLNLAAVCLFWPFAPTLMEKLLPAGRPTARKG